MASEGVGSSQSWKDVYRGMSSDNIKGLVLALSSSIFIGASFIVKKKGLKKAAASGVRAGVGGYSYLFEPLWWVGMITSELWTTILSCDIAPFCNKLGDAAFLQVALIVGEVANFAAYAFAPAILVTPLGALSIIISAVLAHVILRERLHTFGILGCALCVVGSITIVLHAPQEREIESVTEVWDLATEPELKALSTFWLTCSFSLLCCHGDNNFPSSHISLSSTIWADTHYVLYWSLLASRLFIGRWAVMSVKAIGIALKLTLSGMNQLIYPQTWAFTMIVIVCIITQMNYLNKALDTFNTAVVSPIYYVMFTSLTILASVIMFKDWDRQNPTQIVTELCGFVTILSGTFLLHKTKDMVDGPPMLPVRLPKHMDEEDGFGQEGIPLKRQDSLRS
ncbi:hypothetical protein MTR67_005785 [Solanum verrucosum]|uniref:Probable magnesium transporter n=1 Tax=Solanum verrucosum TaxID=315347 RepID=A0AAF0TGK1_SOLVR|nr:hypothetical protein MTR67_005785 [Solanum verrucosum]